MSHMPRVRKLSLRMGQVFRVNLAKATVKETVAFSRFPSVF